MKKASFVLSILSLLGLIAPRYIVEEGGGGAPDPEANDEPKADDKQSKVAAIMARLRGESAQAEEATANDLCEARDALATLQTQNDQLQARIDEQEAQLEELTGLAEKAADQIEAMNAEKADLEEQATTGNERTAQAAATLAATLGSAQEKLPASEEDDESSTVDLTDPKAVAEEHQRLKAEGRNPEAQALFKAARKAQATVVPA